MESEDMPKAVRMSRNQVLDEVEHLRTFSRLSDVFADVVEERIRQQALWGNQRKPMLEIPESTSLDLHRRLAIALKDSNDNHIGGSSWDNILLEEVHEAFAESDPVRQREELVHVAAVAIEIIEHIDNGTIVEEDD